MIKILTIFKPRVSLFSKKLKSKRTRPFIVTQVFLHGAVELENKEGIMFVVTGKEDQMQEVFKDYYLNEVEVIKVHASFQN